MRVFTFITAVSLTSRGTSQVGEFVEVSNASETDPAAWLARIRIVNKSSFTVRTLLAKPATKAPLEAYVGCALSERWLNHQTWTHSATVRTGRVFDIGKVFAVRFFFRNFEAIGATPCSCAMSANVQRW
jgi:hypothetical protein